MNAGERVAVVTGGSRGIGAAVAVRLASDGWTVLCVSRSGEAPSSPMEARSRLTGVALDVRDAGAVGSFFAGAAADAALLVNCAGIHVEHDASTITAEELREVMAVNAEAPLLLSQHFAAARDGREGVIVNVGSFFAGAGVPGSLAYAASKAALASMTQTLAVEWGRRRIWVVDVAPGYVETDINREFLHEPAVERNLARRIPRGGPSSADDLAELLVRLSSPAVASQLTGHTISADGGHRHRL